MHLGPELTHEGENYLLDRQDGPWFLYRGARIVRELYSFLIIKANPDQDSGFQMSDQPMEGKNILTVKCAARQVILSKLHGLADGSIQRLSYRLLKPRENDLRDAELAAYSKMSIDDVWRVLDGKR